MFYFAFVSHIPCLFLPYYLVVMTHSTSLPKSTSKWGVSRSDGSPQVWGNVQVEAGGTGGEGIYLRPNKGERSSLNTREWWS